MSDGGLHCIIMHLLGILNELLYGNNGCKNKTIGLA